MAASIAKVFMGFLTKPISDKIQVGEDVTKGLAANADLFVNPPITVTDLIDVNNRVQSAKTDAGNGDKDLLYELSVVEKEWDDKFRQTANWVSFIAGGSVEIIRKSGFKATKAQKTARPNMGMLSNVSGVPGRGKGKCTAQCDKAEGAVGYVAVLLPVNATLTMNGNTLEVNINGESIYFTVSTKASGIEINNLQSAKQINLNMYSFNPSGSGPISPSQDVTPSVRGFFAG